jgi:hypothetical protein
VISIRTGLAYQGELDPAFELSDHFDYLIAFEELLRVFEFQRGLLGLCRIDPTLFVQLTK